MCNGLCIQSFRGKKQTRSEQRFQSAGNGFSFIAKPQFGVVGYFRSGRRLAASFELSELKIGHCPICG